MKVEPLFHNAPTARADEEERKKKVGHTKEAPPVPAERPEHKEEKAQADRLVEPVINGVGVRIEFVVDDPTGRTLIRLYDKESGRLIRQIPPEETIAFLRQVTQGKGSFLSLHL